jgi:malonate-semialdehyde dehydrogenase (acetylating)/methylmalonate-semialdehyde dehydrogenase
MTATAVPTHLKVCPVLIGGKSFASRGDAVVQMNPATGEPVALLPNCTRDEIAAAVDAAQQAFPAWSATPALQRAQVLFRFRHLLEAHEDELTALITEENGKTLAEGRGSYQRGLECVEFACGAPSLLMGETLPRVSAGVDSVSVRAALGVCAGITPFNFPVMVPLWMFPMAIACGNTFVLKPSERVPRSAVRLAELMYEAGLPAGVLNVVHGMKDAVDALITDTRVKAVSFVGSSAVAKYVYQTAAAGGKRVQALGGAKNHSVVMPDCDLGPAVESIMASSFGNAGERCVATSVVIAIGEIGDRLVSELVKAAGALRVGPGAQPGCMMGPVITAQAREKILRYISLGQEEGATLARDGRQDPVCSGSGYFVGPTIFDHVKSAMRIAREEIFGPVLSVIRAGCLEEAVAIINGTEQGNASSIYTRSGDAARQFAAVVETGMVGVNLGVPAPVALFPFSGWKTSFYGDAHVLGKDAVRFYTESKVITSRW